MIKKITWKKKFSWSIALAHEITTYAELHVFPHPSKDWLFTAWSALVSLKESETNEALPGYKIKVDQKRWQWKNWNSCSLQAAKLRDSECRAFSKDHMKYCVQWTDSKAYIYIYIFEQGKNWPQKPTINNYINKNNELEYIYLRHIATLSTPVDIRNHVD